MSARSRKRGRRHQRRSSLAPAAPNLAATRRPSHPEERNRAVRATLTPLAPGERPWPLRIAVLLAAAIGIADLVQAALGNTIKLGHTHTSLAGVALFSVLMLVCAAGMWQRRYWAVLGFQALLTLVIVAFTLVLVTANDPLRAVAAIAVMAGGGFLFFKLVRVLSRLQMPERPGQS